MGAPSWGAREGMALIVTLRRTIGRLALLAGAGIVVYQGVYFKQHGLWRPFSLTLVVEGVMRLIGEVMVYLPFVAPEGVEMFLSFQASQLPGALFRLFHVVPLSAFLLALGYFFVKWEKYLG
ncbi:MAG: hypothetical protein A3J27_09530 [Candidatus Tectomicrobia bacterium RIFCSPLOWO2_12_FULL_69_37]|nr:MAG: hypothetical protein A3J27_09530 [Candidatus Tectomicrobia bacterium RIFCSPLOWO2_12_FULL_69_37]